MRTPQDVPPRPARSRSGHARWWIVGAIVVLIVVLGSLHSLATIYTDSLWFSSLGFHRVWSTLLAVKVGLFASFGAAFFVLMWVNLMVCDRIAEHVGGADDDLVHRYQRTLKPYAGWIHAVLALVSALIAGATAIGQWNDWLLFTHATSFPGTDPQFNMNDGFFVFRLPFLQFLVDWVLASLIVVFLFVLVFHYLNGGIRSKTTPRVRPAVKVHLSVILALVALAKAAGYVLARYGLDMSTNGYVEGAGYADVHARLPALEVLFFVSLFAAAILVYNIRRQGWTLPVLAVGTWGFVALAIGVIYPAALQALKVTPAQSALEGPYIKRNIEATRYAYGLGDVKVSKLADSTVIPSSTVQADITTLSNIRLWDPSRTISLTDFKTKQDISSYYTFETVQVERHTTLGTMRPVIVGVRQVNASHIPSRSWVNTHLEYTHGEGLVLAEANAATAKGNPVFAIDDVPPKSDPGYPKVTQPAVYFGVTQTGYVVADTHQPELDGQRPTGADVEGHYAGDGGVNIGSLLTRAAFALRFGTLNLVLSNLITPASKIMFVRDVRTIAEKAAPFLSFTSQPYPVLVGGHIDWVLNAYTTSVDFPYSQNADTQNVPSTSGLPSSYNYVRNSVEVVVDAYTGRATFYAMDGSDPILRAYESAFPDLFTQETQMPPAVRDQLRYGTDLFAVQAAVYGRYHITSAPQFYTAGDAWIVTPTTGVASPNQSLQFKPVYSQGEVVSGTYRPMTPIYEVMAEPGETTQSFTITDAYVPAGGGGTESELLRAMLVGNSNPTMFGQLQVYETPPGASKIGPIYADSEIEQTTTVSSKITLLNKEGSHVLLGNIVPVLVGPSVVYVRPLYVISNAVPQPQLKYVIAVLGQQVSIEQTLGAALNSLLGTTLRSTGGVLTTTPTSPTVPTSPAGKGASSSAAVEHARTLLAQASRDFAQAQADLKTGTLGGYQDEIAAAQAASQQAERDLGGSPSTSSTQSSDASSSGTTGASSSGSPSGATGVAAAAKSGGTVTTTKPGSSATTTSGTGSSKTQPRRSSTSTTQPGET